MQVRSYTKKRVCANCGHDGFMWENVTLVGEGVAERIVTRRACARCNTPSPYGDNDRIVDFGGTDVSIPAPPEGGGDEEKRTTDTGGGRPVSILASHDVGQRMA